MKIVHYSQTPLAGAPWHIVKCLQKYSNLDVKLINWKHNYADKREFPYEMLFPKERQKASQMIREADIIHIHNQLPPNLIPLIDKKRQKVVATVHSVPRLHNWQSLLYFADHSFVIRQPYQIEEYKNDNIKSIPTPIDIYEIDPLPKCKDKIVITYAPTIRAGIKNKASKGYPQVKEILDKLQMKYPNDIQVNLYWDKPHIQDLMIKRSSHIIIDDPVHQSFHLSGLFGLSSECVVFNGININTMTNYYNNSWNKKTEDNPFHFCNLNSLMTDIDNLIKDRERISDISKRAREWMIEYWNPKDIVKIYQDIYENL